MIASWTQWEGQVVNNEFHLRKYLGGSNQSGVFLTEHQGRGLSQAAIKLVPADAASSDLYLARWRLAEKLSHPHLIRLLQDGSCRLDGLEFLFVVMEYADENLGGVLPERSLTAAEVRDFLGPALDALRYLHGRGLVHGHFKPANVLAANDKIKLSSDGLCAPGAAATPEKPGPYDPPEKASGPFSAAADIWSLGMTLAETMTQRLPDWSEKEQDPILPESLPEPFFEIVRGCLRRDPQHRLTVADIAARLRPAQAVAHPTPQAQPGTQPQPQEARQARPAPPMRSRLLPAVVAVFGVVALFGVLGLVTRQPESRKNLTSPPAVKPESKPQTQSDPAPNAKRESGPEAQSEPAANAKPGSGPEAQSDPVIRQQASANDIRPVATRVKPSPAPSPDGGSSSFIDRQPENDDSTVESFASGVQVLRQVLPDTPQKSLDTIQGTVRVGIRVQVDSAGNVVETAIDFPGPSRYFARLAAQAAQSWKFAPSTGPVRQYILHFEFKNTVTTASATVAP